ncbi:hypothetical protein D3C76_1446800 [compost metagenome]
MADLHGRDGQAERCDYLAAVITHGCSHRGDGRLEEAFAADIAAQAIGLDQVEQLQHGLGRARRKLLQMLFGIQLAQLAQAQVGQQDAPQHRGVGRQARADGNCAGEHRGW